MGYFSVGVWCFYGFGLFNENLFGYVVFQSGGVVFLYGGVSFFSNMFLLGLYQGLIFKVDQIIVICNI